MKVHFKFLYTLVLTLFIFNINSFAQDAADVLENGIRVNNDRKIILRFIDNQLKYAIVTSIDDSPSFIPVPDSVIFMMPQDVSNIYLWPMNPLNFSSDSESKIIVDPVNESVSMAFGSINERLSGYGIFEFLESGSVESQPELYDFDIEAAEGEEEEEEEGICKERELIETGLIVIQERLQNDQKNKLNDTFNKLKRLDFNIQKETLDEINSIEKDFDVVKKEFEMTFQYLELIQKGINELNCGDENDRLYKFIYSSYRSDLNILFGEQKKRLDAVEKSLESVKSSAKKSAIGEGVPGLQWLNRLTSVKSPEGKVSLTTVSIKSSGVELNDKKEIVSSKEKELTRRLLRIRRFKRFIPEVSVGVAYTFFKYNSYGTTTDSTGQQFVDEPQENEIRNLNISTMINFNYYIPDSQIHPFYQLGFGVNSEIPTLLTGFGIRTNILGNTGKMRIAISGGIAMTWLQELNDLEVGDPVDGTGEIESDLQYEFSWPPKPYVGIQLNF